MSKQKTNKYNDTIKMYDAVKYSNINLSLNLVKKNINKFNLCNISYPSMCNLCKYFNINSLKQQNDILSLVMIYMNYYCTNQDITKGNINDKFISKLYHNTNDIMRNLKIINKDNIFHHLNKREFINVINVIVTLISIRINCKECNNDTLSLIVLYYTLSILHLSGRKIKNKKNNNISIVENQILPEFKIDIMRDACLNYHL